MAKFCTNCGKEIPEDANACPFCGAMVNPNMAVPFQGAPVQNVAVAPAGMAQGVPGNPGATVIVNNNAATRSNGWAIGGLISSIISLVFCCGCFNVITLIVSIVGLIKAKDYNGEGKGMSIAGIIISAIGVIWIILISLFFALGEIGASTYY